MKKVTFGVIGFGTVGSGVVKLFLENRKEIEKRLDFTLELKKVADKLLCSKEGVKVPPGMLTADAYEVINDPSIDIVVELVGGTTIAKKFILDAIAKGKHVVTANKALLAEQGDEIFGACEKYGCRIGYEAAVAGVIPIIRTIRESLAADRVENIYGIINGTCNYILTRMTEEGRQFKEILADAQRLGYAEADPTLDVEGIDAAHKLAILAGLSFGTKVRFADIYHQGIGGISNLDIEFAAEFGYAIKLLAIAKRAGKDIEARVHPTLIPRHHPLAGVRMEYNSVYVQGLACGSMLLYGKGAGMMPTASAVAGDIVDIARDIARGTVGGTPNRGCKTAAIKTLKIKPMAEIESKFFIRMNVVDSPGVLAAIAGILGKRGISIASVIQKGRDKGGKGVPLVITTHETKEKELVRALGDITRLKHSLGTPAFLRIEENI